MTFFPDPSDESVKEMFERARAYDEFERQNHERFMEAYGELVQSGERRVWSSVCQLLILPLTEGSIKALSEVVPDWRQRLGEPSFLTLTVTMTSPDPNVHKRRGTQMAIGAQFAEHIVSRPETFKWELFPLPVIEDDDDEEDEE
jgi:hypothetical protein